MFFLIFQIKKIFFKFPSKKPIKSLGHGAFRYDAHGDEKQTIFLALIKLHQWSEFQNKVNTVKPELTTTWQERTPVQTDHQIPVP